MNFIRKVLDELKNPSKKTAIFAFITFACAFSATISVIVNQILPLLANFLYFLSALSFGYCVYVAVIYYKKARRKIRKKIQQNEIANRFTTDYNFRTIVCSAGSWLLSIGYTAYNLVCGIIFDNIWYVSLGAYYLILSLYRGLMLYQTRRLRLNKELSESEKNIKKVKIYRTAGVIIFILPVALNVIIWLVRNDLGGFRYYGIAIVVNAVYTVVKVVMAINNMVKVRHSSDFVVHAARNINLIAALVSLFALQTALFAAYGTGDNATYNASFGTAICVFCVGLAITMIFKANKEIKRLTATALTA